MDDLKLADLNLSLEESRDIIEFLARKKNIKNYKRKSNNELLRAIKENKSNKEQSKNKKGIDIIREELKEISLNFQKVNQKKSERIFIM